MPDQPDDARKRQQRGVFPPFFAPRTTGRGESAPTPPSGSWRRVSRLFTPPEVARQRRTPAAPQTPYTPPVAPELPAEPVAAAPEETPQASFEASEALVQQPEVEAPVDSALPLELEQAAADVLEAFDPMAFDEGADSFVVESLETEPISLAPSDIARMEVDVAFDPSVYPAVDGAAVDAALDAQLDAAVVDAPTDAALDAAAVDVAAVDAPMDAALDAPVDLSKDVEATSVAAASDYAFAPSADYDDVESIENYLADDAAFVDDAVGFESTVVSDSAALAGGALPENVLEDAPQDEAVAAYDDRTHFHDEAPFADDVAAVADGAVASGSSLEDQTEEIDPWAGAELPEPAFGSIGWPSSEVAALAADQPAEGVDEMSAALAWSDAESPSGEHRAAAADAGEADASNDDALSGMAHELRDSSSAWVTDADVADDDADVSARARFYGGERTNALPADPDFAADPDILVDPDVPADPDFVAHSSSMGDPAAAPEAGSYAAELARLAAAEAAEAITSAPGDDAGAAIADALARVAARIRAGEVDLPIEVVGASDESALAAALAALLRGPRR